MGDFDRCKKCGKYDFLSRHKCPPEWDAIYVGYDDEDESEKAFGIDAESAVLMFAEENFPNWEYPEEMEIWVKKAEDTEWLKFDVSVESVPEFFATLKAEGE